MKVLVACEFFGIVRDAFIKQGHDAVSCDILPSEKPGPHIQDSIFKHGCEGWDLMIAFPPCTHLAVSGARWFKDKKNEQHSAIEFFLLLWDFPIKKIAVENPVGIMSTIFRKPDQYIQPWMYGHGETKKTCIWLRNLPKLTPTRIVEGRKSRVHQEPPSPDRWKNRSRTYQGIANAMAEQWGTA